MQETNQSGVQDTAAARSAGDNSALALLGAAGLGAALMYAFDSSRAARRRKMTSDQLVHAGPAGTDAPNATQRDLSNREAHETAESVPAFQGGAEREGGMFARRQENRTTAARLLTGVTGGALALYGARRHDTVGNALGLAGLALFTRGSGSTGFARSAGVGGRRRAVDVKKTINIAAPPDEVFRRITEWESFPQWMSHVREVTSSGPRRAVGERTHWVVDGPAGVPIAWDAEITRFEPGRLVSWKTVEGSTVEHAGTLEVTPNADGGTRVQVRMSYKPPAGAVGRAGAAFLGRDPKRQMKDDLMRLESAIEAGRAPREAAASGAEGSGGNATSRD